MTTCGNMVLLGMELATWARMELGSMPSSLSGEMAGAMEVGGRGSIEQAGLEGASGRLISCLHLDANLAVQKHL